MIFINQKKISKQRGFTLIELMVSLSVFTIVLLLSMGSIVSVLSANQKSQSYRAVMDNLNTGLETMARKIRFGENYHCGLSLPLTTPLDCASGSPDITITDSNGNQVTYGFDQNRIYRSINGASMVYVTAPDVTIQTLTFFVNGAPAFASGTNLLQPRVVMVVKGYAGEKVSSRTTFYLQTTISQSKLDS